MVLEFVLMYVLMYLTYILRQLHVTDTASHACG